MLIIIRFHVSSGNNIITDGWNAYDWMNPNSGYNRIIHYHRHNDFGFGAESTSYIESVWGDLKRLLTKIYASVRSENFVYLIKECVWLIKNKDLNNNQKLNEIKDILNHIVGTVQFKLFEKEDIEDFNKSEYDLGLNDSDSSENESSNFD